MIQRSQPYRHGEVPCGYSGGEEIAEELKKVAKEMNLKGKLRVARSGCFDLCALGANMMIWPEGLWHRKVTKEDIPQISHQYMKLEEADKTKKSESASAAVK
jgi:(2Fe-2S) ferredoxin